MHFTSCKLKWALKRGTCGGFKLDRHSHFKATKNVHQNYSVLQQQRHQCTQENIINKHTAQHCAQGIGSGQMIQLTDANPLWLWFTYEKIKTTIISYNNLEQPATLFDVRRRKKPQVLSILGAILYSGAQMRSAPQRMAPSDKIFMECSFSTNSWHSPARMGAGLGWPASRATLHISSIRTLPAALANS